MLDPRKREHYATDPAVFRADLMVDAGGRDVPLGTVLDPWQRQDFEASDPGWRRAIGQQTEGGFSRCYFERPRGHSKTSDLATMAVWAIAFAPRAISGIAAAADSEQGALLLDAIRRLMQLNPMLGVLDVQQRLVRNRHTQSELRIMASDVGSSYGRLVDFIIGDELTHWPTNGEGLWHSLVSTAAKRERCMMVVIANAGLGQGTSWQWTARESCRTSEDWYFHSLEGPVASWISPKLLAEQRRLLPAQAYRRVWENIWSLESGDALCADDVEACVTLQGPDLWFYERHAPYVAALDLGIRNDRSALVVLGMDVPKQKLRLAHAQSWAPATYGGQVPLEVVKEDVLAAVKKYRIDYIKVDPWQAALLSEQLTAAGVYMMDQYSTPANLNCMARTLLETFVNRKLDMYRDSALIRDLLRLSIVERSTGFKLEAPRDASGHCDLGFALAMLLPSAHTVLERMTYPPDDSHLHVYA